MISALLLALMTFEDHGYGPVDPVLLPDVVVTRDDGKPVRLRELTAGRRTAVQFIFTHCPTACPLLGSLFGKVEKSLEPGAGALLSITVDPGRDTPERLAAWRKQFTAGSRWVAVRPDPAALKKLLETFGQKDGPPSGHALQVFFVDSESRYVARTTELPRAINIADALAGHIEMAGINSRAVHEAAAAPEAATGEEIYRDAQGVVPRLNGETLNAKAARCANCHGERGEGRREGPINAAPLRRAALVEPQSRRGGPPSRYSRESFCASLRTGVDPAGIMLDSAMPRYTLSDPSCAALWDFVTRQ
jgi:cytochrome oxidase Cu insertion factor (SCO1/SenC/PrrC family)